MANNRVSVVVDIKAQADNLNQIINQSKKNLQTLSPNIDPKQANTLMRQFDTLQSKIEATKNKLASGLNTQAAFTKASQDINRFGQDYTSIIQKIQDLGIDPKKIIPKTAEVEAEMKKLAELFEKQSKIAGQKYGQGITKELNKELRKAAQSGDTKGVRDIGKKAANDLTAKNRSLIAQRGQITKFYGQEAENKIEAELANQRNILATQGQGAQKAQAQKFGKNISQLEADLKIVNQHKAYQQNHQAIEQSTQAYAQQAIQLNNLQIEIDETTGKISIMAKPVRDEAAQALNQLSNSTQQVSSQTNSMSSALDVAAQKFQQLDARAKKMSQLKSYFGYFFSIGSIINYTSRAIRNAIKDFKELDKLFNEISVVTGTSMDELWSRFRNLNRIAQEYGVTTKDVVSVQKLYYQQGRSMAEITRLTSETLKFAKISGLEFAEATDYMTSVINAYKIAAEDASTVTDTFAALSSSAAVNQQELAVAISKTASLAANAGAEFQDTSAYLAKIIETTREAPETAGTALKTIIARFSEVKDLTEDEAELLEEDFNFNNIEKALKTVGIQSKNANGQMRGFSEIINDLGPIWDSLTTNQQRYIATAAAGARQQSRFIALMDDWGRTQELQGIAADSAGLGNKQLALSLDSIETELNKLKSTWQEFYSNFLNSGLVKGFVSALNTLLSVLNKIADVPIIGTPALVASIAVIGILLKKAYHFGKTFGSSFGAGKIAGEAQVEAAAAPAKAAAEAAEGTTLGTIKGTTKATVEEQIEATKAALDLEEAKLKGILEGTIEGDAKGQAKVVAQKQAELRGLFAQKTNPTGFGLGQKFGNLWGGAKNSGFAQGMRHPIATTKGAIGGAKAAKAAGTGMAAGAKAGAGAAVGKGAAAGGAAIAGVVAIWVAAIAAVVIGTLAIISAIRAKEEKNVREVANKTSESIKKSTENVANVSKNYNKALELQRKGLTRTTEEMEQYQESLKGLQEKYPSMVKVLSDGTLELAAGAESVYKQMLSAERQNIKQQTKSLLEVTGDKTAVASGIALTSGSQGLQEEIKNIASNMSSMSIDQLDALGTEGAWGDSITSEDLAMLAEKGLSRETLDEAIESTIFGEMTQEDYQNLLKTMAGEGGDYDTSSQEYKLVEAIAGMSSKSSEEFAKTLLVGASDQGAFIQEGLGLAQTYASEYGTTVSSTISKTIENSFGKVKDQGQATQLEQQMKAFFASGKQSQERYNDYAESITKDMKISEAYDVQSPEDIVKQFGMSYQAASFAYEGIKSQQDELKKLIDVEKERYKEAVGEEMDMNDEFFANMSLETMTSYVRQVADVASRYGQAAASEFEKTYKEFTENTLKGNQKLAETFSETDFFDNQSIAKTAAAFMEATGSCEEFLEVAGKTSGVADRSFRNLEEFANGMVTDIENIKQSFDSLGDAINGELDLENAIKLVGKLGGTLSFSDFEATSNGYQLSEEKAMEYRDQLLTLKVNEYKIEMALNRAKAEQIKAEILSNKTLQQQFGLNAANFQQMYEGMRLRVMEGVTINDTNEALYQTLKTEGLLVKMTELFSLSEVMKESEVLIEQFEKLTIIFDKTNTEFGRIITKLEKILELLDKIDYYSDIDGYLDNLQNKIDAYDFTIEFSSNIEEKTEAIKNKINTINEQTAGYLAKVNKAEDRTKEFRADLENEWGDYVEFDDDGNLLHKGEAIQDWINNIAELSGSLNEYDKIAAEDEQSRLEILLDKIDAYKEERKIANEAEASARKNLQAQEKLYNELRKNVTEMEDTFIELFIQRDEEILEHLEERYDKMKEMDDEYLDSVRDAVEEERRLRDQNKAYDDVAQMERKLALLQMGGGSAVEIQQLQEEIKQARQDIADTEQDNILDNIEKENEKRATAMDEEVTYQQAVLEQKKEDRRLYNEEMKTLMAQDKETIMNTWKALDKEWQAATAINKELMEKDMENLVATGRSSADALADTEIQKIETAFGEVKTNGVDELHDGMETFVNYVCGIKTTNAINRIGEIENAYFNAGEDAKTLLGYQRELNEELKKSSKYYSNPNNFKIEEGDDDDSPFQTMYTVAEAYTLGGNHSRTHYKLIDDQGNVSWVSQANVGDLTVGGVFKGNAEHIERTKSKFEDFQQTRIAFYKGENEENVRDFDYEWTDFYDENGDQYKFMKLDFSTLSEDDVKKQHINGFMEKNGVLLLRLQYPITTTDGDTLYWLDYVDATEMDLTELSRDELKLQLREYTDYYTPKEKNGAMTYSEAYERWLKSNGKKYATGGMVDYTGPAWVDGTKSRPEAFLSANDTQLIASLRDILRAGVSPSAFAATSLQKSGDTYYTIHINVDELGDGYSVDDLVEEMEERILQATGNTNVVKLTR